MNKCGQKYTGFRKKKRLKYKTKKNKLNKK